MKKQLFVALLALTIGSVFAGPVAISSKESKAVVQPVEKECTWTGFYIGAHGGYSFGDNLDLHEGLEKESTVEDGTGFDLDQDGAIYGGQIGVNWQINSWFVTGGEVALSGTDISDSQTVSSDGGDEVNKAHFSSDWVVDVKLRIGVSFMHNHLLAYATGGPSFARFHYDNHQVNTGPERWHAEEGRVGGLAGGGLEYAFNCHWSIRLEYDHYYFGSDNVIGLETAGSNHGVQRVWVPDIGDRNAVVAGVNFKF